MLKPPPAGDKAPFWATFAATGAYCGYIPWASGTFGALAGLLLLMIPVFERPAVHIVLTAILMGVGVVASRRVAAVEGHRLSKSAVIAKNTFQPGPHSSPDPSIVVVDEIVGMWVAMIMLPRTMLAAGIAFVLFRVFDILKPFPPRQVESVPDGWGIMLDDVVAGLYANLATQVVLLLIRMMAPGLLA